MLRPDHRDALLAAAWAAWRQANRAYAAAAGHFWIPCPRCGVEYGGHERSHHPSFGLPTAQRGVVKGVCNDCAAIMVAKYVDRLEEMLARVEPVEFLTAARHRL